jgi:hypothetical protein
METLIAFATWVGVAAAGLAVTALLVVATLAWLLDHPILEEGETEPRAGRH